MSRSIRCKFRCHTVGRDSSKNENVVLHAVYSDTHENASWSKATPSGQLTLCISNPDAQGAFEPGEDYYLDISPAKDAEAETPPAE